MASRGTAVIIRDIMWDNRLPIWICSRSSSSTPSLSARTHHSAWCPAGVTWWPRVTPFGRPSSHARERKAHPSCQLLHLRCGRWVPTTRCPIKRRGSRVYNGGRCATCVPSVTRTSRWIGRCGARTGQSRGRSAGRERPRVCIEGSARFSFGKQSSQNTNRRVTNRHPRIDSVIQFLLSLWAAHRPSQSRHSQS